ncbi:MAG: hypothetical protein A4E60_01962 [Syntrophorhabdus sp. PtaB.Bin047]|nr:MAG: hypothetical protein A4E60_01962 [Syntrophorhabdus sp. PtaB.Bin047]
MVSLSKKSTILAAIFFVALSFPGTSAFADPPSNETIQEWWHKNSREEMTIEGKPVQIGLRSKEVAFLVPVGFYHRGRNSIWHAVLVRPALEEVREAEDPVGNEFEARDLDHDGISEIVTSVSGSGQGTTRGDRSIIQFDSWKPVVLHQASFHDDLGWCGPPSLGYEECTAKEVTFKFPDLDGDGKDDLLEEIVIKKGSRPDRLKARKKTNRYLFNGNTFIRKK